MMTKQTTPKTLQEAIIFFSTPENCINYLVARRWPNGVICPTCGRDDVSFLAKQSKWQCKSAHARRQFTVKVGTIFEDSPLGLDKWLTAIWMLTNCKNGVSSYEVHRAIGVTQKTAWFMLHRLRHAALTDSFNAPLDGVVEADETFLGVKDNNKHASKRIGGMQGGKGKAVVFGMLDRDGDLRMMHKANLRAQNVKGIIREHVEPGSAITTDEHPSFVGLSGDYYHHRVNHPSGEYVRHFCIHTNGIESVWGLLKRRIIGIHRYVSPKHLCRYLEKMPWRFNRREQEDGDRLNSLLAFTDGRRLTYWALVA